MKDYYQTLGVPENAGESEIKTAYRKLAKQHHPDMNPENRKAAEARFKEISEAYYVLGNAKRKQEFDMMKQGGAAYSRGARGYDPAAGFDMDDLLSHLGFATGRAARGGRRAAGRDYGIFDDVFSQFYSSQSGGGGGRARVYSTNMGQEEFNSDIEALVKVPASLAKTGGKADLQLHDGKTVTVKIPPGTTSGTRLRLKGLGEECPCCHKRGDLFLKISFS